MLRDWLASRALPAVFVREPGSTALGERLRELLLAPPEGGPQVSAISEALLYTAARAELVEQVIRPALAQGRIVVADRYIDSTLAYQGYGLGLPVGELRRLNDLATGSLWPRLTLLFDLPAQTGLGRSRRARAEADRIEARGLDFHTRVVAGYQQLARQEPARFRVVDGNLGVDHAHEVVVRAVNALIMGGAVT
jgi:dTMP kinase